MNYANENILEKFLVSMTNIIDAANVYLDSLSTADDINDSTEKVSNDKNENKELPKSTNKEVENNDEIDNFFNNIFSAYEYRWDNKTLSDKSTTDDIFNILDERVFVNRQGNYNKRINEITFVLPKDDLTLELKWNTEHDRFEGKYYVIGHPNVNHSVHYDELKREIIFDDQNSNDVKDCSTNDYAVLADAPNIASISISKLEGAEDFVVEPVEPVEIPSETEYFKEIQNCKIPHHSDINEEKVEDTKESKVSRCDFAKNLYKELNNTKDELFCEYLKSIEVAVDRIFDYKAYKVDKDSDKINGISFTFDDIFTHANSLPWGDYSTLVSNFNFNKFTEFMKERYGFKDVYVFSDKSMNPNKLYTVYCELI